MAQFEGLVRRRTAAEGTSTRRPRHSLGPLRQVPSQVHATKMTDGSTPPTLLCATPTCSQLFSFVEVRRVYPWLAMLRDRLTNTMDAYQLNRFANG